MVHHPILNYAWCSLIYQFYSLQKITINYVCFARVEEGFLASDCSFISFVRFLFGCFSLVSL